MSHSRNDSEVPNPGPSDATVKLFIADFGSAELTMRDSLGGSAGATAQALSSRELAGSNRPKPG